MTGRDRTIFEKNQANKDERVRRNERVRQNRNRLLLCVLSTALLAIRKDRFSDSIDKKRRLKKNGQDFENNSFSHVDKCI